MLQDTAGEEAKLETLALLELIALGRRDMAAKRTAPAMRLAERIHQRD